MILIILLIICLGVFLFFSYLEDNMDEQLNKIMDESCYYCIHSMTPYSIRDKSKNTCKVVDNTNWCSERIRHCKYRCKR